MTRSFDELLRILDIEPIELNMFRGHSPPMASVRVFGGQVIAQALCAATRTVVAERLVHSLHAYFLRPGDPKIPILYTVDRVRDGKSFTTRRVTAIQRGEAILTMEASFQVEESGVSHQVQMPAVPPPESLMSESELMEKFGDNLPAPLKSFLSQDRPVDIRPVDLRYALRSPEADPIQHIWIKTTGKMPDDPRLHRMVMAFASDLGLLWMSTRPHVSIGKLDEFQTASLDHALWFHRAFRIDDWLLYSQESPTAFGARGFNRGAIFTRSGTLVASVAQEGLVRRQRPGPNLFAS